MRNLRSWWRARTRRANRERGFVEAGVAAAGGLLVVGAVVGNGVASTLIDMSDGQTWLPDDDGRIVQINPATGQPERRLVVGEPGSELVLSQRDGRLIVQDLTTGTITSVDLAGLVAGGARMGEEDTQVLVGGGQVVLVDLEPGTVRAVDPLTLRDLGRPYRTDDLADAVIDADGSVWIITTDGLLTELDYAAEAGEFTSSTERPVEGAGGQTRLVPHPSGVTVFAPDRGAVLQVGAGPDVAVTVAALHGSVAEADFSPSDLVPASATDAGRVFLLSGGSLLNVDVGGLGCTRPGAPAVFSQKVYVPCLGEGRVIVLDRNGARAGADIVVPGGGDPVLVVDDGRLFVSTPRDGRIVMVQADGSTQLVDAGAAEVPVQDVDRPVPVRPTAPVAPPPVTTPPVAPPATTTQPPPSTSPGTLPDPGEPETPDAPGVVDPPPPPATEPVPEDLQPQGVAAQVLADGTVRITWTAPAVAPERYWVFSADGVSRPVPDGATSLDVADLACATDTTLTVTAVHADGTTAGASVGVRTADCAPGVQPADLAPRDVAAALRPDGTVRVSWTAPALPATEYRVTSSDGTSSQVVPAGTTQADVTGLTCGRTLDLTVSAYHSDGQIGSAAAAVTTADCAVDPADRAPRDVSASLRADESVRVTWSAPVVAPTGYRVTSSDGAFTRTLTAATTQVDATGLTCGTTVRLTVTATHDGHPATAASADVTTADCAVDPADLAPRNVSAGLRADESVRVTWNAPVVAPTGYRVTASDGSFSRTLPAGTTQVDATGLTCETTLTFTVTATHSGHPDAPAQTAPVGTAACPVTPAAPVRNVTASVSGSSVTVTWQAASSGADEYLVSPSSGPATSAGTRTSVTMTLAPGTYTFTVETRLGASSATSSASNQVTVANVPGAPGSPSASAVSNTGSTVTVDVSWSAAAANGSAVTGYTVAWSGGGTSGSTGVGGSSTSTRLAISCSGQSLCTSGGTLNVSVTATNGMGTGAAASTSATVGAPPPPPPANGDAVIGSVEWSAPGLYDPEVPYSVQMSPPPGWAAHTGGCTLVVTEGGTVVDNRTLPCSTSGYVSGGSSPGGTVSAYVVANGNGARSATASEEIPPRNTWGYCEGPGGICYDPVSLPGDPDVEIVPAPWAPPAVPNPPVLAAGVGLLGAAGLLRTMRRVQRLDGGTSPAGHATTTPPRLPGDETR